jgi:hypothetical protein
VSCTATNSIRLPMLEVENVKPLHHIAVISWRFAIKTTRGSKTFLCDSAGRQRRTTDTFKFTLAIAKEYKIRLHFSLVSASERKLLFDSLIRSRTLIRLMSIPKEKKQKAFEKRHKQHTEPLRYSHFQPFSLR